LKVPPARGQRKAPQGDTGDKEHRPVDLEAVTFEIGEGGHVFRCDETFHGGRQTGEGRRRAEELAGKDNVENDEHPRKGAARGGIHRFLFQEI
jgi:hypothetical protein